MRNIGLIAIAIVIYGAAATTAQTARRTAPPAPVHVTIIGCV
jgi:hypothetical protein